MEDPQNPHGAAAFVLERMLEARRKVHARSGPDRVACSSDVQLALALQHVNDLVVVVAVVRSPPGRDEARGIASPSSVLGESVR